MNQENGGMMRLVIGLIVGVILGLGLGLLFGYVIAPVQWTDGGPQDLRQDYAAYYWELVTESYDKHGDLELAQKQLGVWDDEARLKAALEYAYVESGPDMKMKMISLQEKVVGDTVQVPTPEPGATPAGETTPPEGGNMLGTLALGFLLVVAFIAVIAFLVLRLRKKPKQVEADVPEETPDWVATLHPEQDIPQTPPLGHFVTSYALGNDVYDESFSIESPTGDFLGECGVGISETIGVGDPDKVTAFEVWLFDKNDIRTVTKVLMSEHAYNDQELRARLATKGEAILAQPNQVITLETLTLRIDAMVTETMYGTGALPPNSFFERMTIELVARNKETATAGESGAEFT
ncbi:MAG: hypothetical protein JXA89_06700 [Anaerolineae bacterium]|nr:hypothetical protein [Anaerolineae bacterium]